jgi:hypothetical protein
MFKSIGNTILSVTGINEISSNPAFAALLLPCLVLTIFWMVRLLPKGAAATGKNLGGVVLGFIKLGVALTIAVTVLNVVLNRVAGSLRTIPIFGEVYAGIVEGIFSNLTLIIVAVGVGIYIASGIFTRSKETVQSGFNTWKAEDGKGLEGVAWPYVIAGTLVPAMLICHPHWNVNTYCIPAAISGIVGIVAIFTVKAAKQMVDNQSVEIPITVEAPREEPKDS